MLLVELVQQQKSWKFDLASALIGAAAALLIAGTIYIRREQIKQFGLRSWAPVVNLRNRLRASREEKYVVALQSALKGLLLFKPDDPTKIFQPPTFRAPPPLPTQLSSENIGGVPDPLTIAFSNIVQGHTRLVVAGPLASGRTTALALTVWQTAQGAVKRKPYAHFPLWIDLAQVKLLPQTEGPPPVERLVQLATLFLPDLSLKWTLTHLRNEPSVILVDNWDNVPPNERSTVARWLISAAKSLPKSCWLIASAQEGYGALVEGDFVAVDLVPASGKATVAALGEGWAQLLGHTEEEIPEEARDAWLWASQAGASLLELTARIVLYWETRELPIRPIDVLDRLLDHHIPHPNLGEGQAEIADQARILALNTLGHIARQHRLEGRAFSQQEILDFVQSLLPPEGERSPKLEGAIRRILANSHLLQKYGNAWVPTHYLWDDFLTAWALVEDEQGAGFAKAHLNDPTWVLLLEFYAGLVDASGMVELLLNKAMSGADYTSLLRAARWSVIAPEDITWRKPLMKALAQTFADPALDQALRLRVGRALVLSAGEGARAFFIQMLRHAAVPIRCASLRGLGWSGSPREMVLITAALKDTNLDIRQSAIRALGDFETPGAVRALQETLYTADEHMLPIIAEALTKTDEGHKTLREATESESLLIRRTAAQGISQIDVPWAQEVLEKLVREDSEWLVRSAAEIGLTTLEEQKQSKAVVLSPPRVDQIEWLMTWVASHGLGLGVGDIAVKMLEKAVEAGESEAKILGAYTLAQIGRTSHLSLLEPLLAHDDPGVQQTAKHAIHSIERRYSIYQDAERQDLQD